MMHREGPRPHLAPEAYRGNKTVSFTANVEGRVPILVESVLVEQLLGRLRTSCEDAGCTCLIYCFMPDHLHVILRGLADDGDTKRAMTKFKKRAGIWLKTQGLPKFQENFHDRVLRWDELRNRAMYVARNPERAGLVDCFTDYPFLGSFAGPVTEVLASIGESREFR